MRSGLAFRRYFVFKLSRHDPPDIVGTPNIGCAAAVGARGTAYRPSPGVERGCSGPSPVDRFGGRPWMTPIIGILESAPWDPPHTQHCCHRQRARLTRARDGCAKHLRARKPDRASSSFVSSRHSYSTDVRFETIEVPRVHCHAMFLNDPCSKRQLGFEAQRLHSRSRCRSPDSALPRPRCDARTIAGATSLTLRLGCGPGIGRIWPEFS